MKEMIYALTVAGNDDYDFLAVLQAILQQACPDNRYCGRLPTLIKLDSDEGPVIANLHAFTTAED